MKRFRIVPPDAPHEFSPELPLSKSIANRQLCIRHLAGSTLRYPIPDSWDSIIMNTLLHQLSQENNCRVFDCGDAGTVFRFLTALLAVSEGEHTITGSARMLLRPCGPLVSALQSLGAEISYLGSHGFPPLRIKGKPLSGGSVDIDASVSSQFISALMMIAPLMPLGLQIRLTGKTVSAPYITMTARLMQAQGIDIGETKDQITIRPGSYRFNADITEADWSAASYWFAFAAMNEDSVIRLRGLKENSIQGDSRLVEIFSHLGVSTLRDGEVLVVRRHGKTDAQIEVDFTPFPDLFPAVAVTCAALGVTSKFTGLETLSIKESNRSEAVGTELGKLGYMISEPDGCFRIGQGKVNTAESITETYNDHRIAMAFAMMAAVNDHLIIDNPGVVAKSYPGFWEDMRRAGFLILPEGEDAL